MFNTQWKFTLALLSFSLVFSSSLYAEMNAPRQTTKILNTMNIPDNEFSQLIQFCSIENGDFNDCIAYEVFRVEQSIKRNLRQEKAAKERDHSLPDTRFMKVPAQVDLLPEFSSDIRGQYSVCKKPRKWYQTRRVYDGRCHSKTRKLHNATKLQWYNEHGHNAYL